MAEAHPNHVVPLVLGEAHAEIEACLQNSNGPALRALTIRLVHRHGLGVWNELRRQPHWRDALPWWEQQLDLQDWAIPSPVSGPVPTATPDPVPAPVPALDPAAAPAPAPTAVAPENHVERPRPAEGPPATSLDPDPAPVVPEAAQDPEAAPDEAVEVVENVAPVATVATMAELLSRFESTTSESTMPALEESAAGLLRNLQALSNEQKAPAEAEQPLAAEWGEATPAEGRTPAAAAEQPLAPGKDDTPTEGNTATDGPQPAASPRHLRDWLPQTLLPHQWPAAS